MKRTSYLHIPLAVAAFYLFLFAGHAWSTPAIPTGLTVDIVNNEMRGRVEYDLHFGNSNYPYSDRTNGCGPDTNIGGWVPEEWNGATGSVRFTPYCDDHDRCYMTLGPTQWACDWNLKTAIESACDRSFTGINALIDLAPCYTVAATYWTFVSAGARLLGGYIDSQTKQQVYDNMLVEYFANYANFLDYVQSIYSYYHTQANSLDLAALTPLFVSHASNDTIRLDILARLMPPPTVSTNVATSITGHSAIINGEVNAIDIENSDFATVTFDYGISTTYDHTVTAGTVSAGHRTSLGIDIIGLDCNTTYHYRIKAVSILNILTEGSDQTFTTLACPPTVVTMDPIYDDHGWLSIGNVNPNGLSTTAWFQWGTTTDYGHDTPVHNMGAGTGVVETNEYLGQYNLACETTYYYRVRAVNTLGTVDGAAKSFTTGACSPPTATTDFVVASTIGSNGATLRGFVYDSGVVTTATFEFGPASNPNYGSSVNATPNIISAGSGQTAVTATITGLICDTPYHYRAKAQSSRGTSFGDEMFFTTYGCAGSVPTVITGVASNITASTATLNGRVAPNWLGTSVYFNYGTTPHPWTLSLDATPSFVNGDNAEVAVTGNLSGLHCGTTYYFWLQAFNMAGATSGNELSFTTLACPPMRLNDTGITTCKPNNGLYDVPCPVAELPGQDADYGTNSFSFTKLDANGNELPAIATNYNCIRDNVTGLVWESKTEDGGLRDKNWSYVWSEQPGCATNDHTVNSCKDAQRCNTKNYIQDVNAAALCGFSDWRLPAVQELLGVFHYGTCNSSSNSYISSSCFPKIDTKYFPDRPGYNSEYPPGNTALWTETLSFSPVMPWVVNFENSNYFQIHPLETSYCEVTHPVRLVRGARSSASFTNNGNGTVTDNSTGLIWARCPEGQSGNSCESGNATNIPLASSAFTAARNSRLGGYSDWRVPNLKELQSLVKYDVDTYLPAIDTAYFPNIPTSEPSFLSSALGLCVNFTNNLGSNGNSCSHYYVRLVRGGQADSNFTLSVIRTGTGGGIVTSYPAGINCRTESAPGGSNAECSANFNGTSVTLTPIPDAESTFNGFDSNTDCIAIPYSNNGVVTMDANKTCTAIFALKIPDVVTGPASYITANGAWLTGTIVVVNANVNVFFEYGPSTSYGTSIETSPFDLDQTPRKVLSSELTDLICNTTYHYRVKAVNSAGPNYGEDQVFTTSACPITAPSADSASVTNITTTSGTLNGTVNDNGADTTVTFDFGSALDYGTTITAIPSTISAGTGSSTVSATLTLLTCGTTYYYRTNAINSIGTATGADRSFTTLPCVGKLDQVISSITLSPATFTVGSVSTASATASSLLPIIFTSATPDICSVSDSMVTGITGGACIIIASQPGDSNYNPAPDVTQTAAVNKYYQTIVPPIAFTPTTLVVNNTSTASATATSGLQVSFSSTTPTICNTGGANGSIITGVTSGSCIIAADQGGNSVYNPAPQITGNVNVEPGLVVTPIMSTGGNLSPNTVQVVSTGATVQFTVTPKNGYIRSHKGVGGTCPQGNWNGDVWTTGAINNNCTVYFNFFCQACLPGLSGWRSILLTTYIVNSSAGSDGSISPSDQRIVNYAATTSFTVTPNTGYSVSSVTGCGGTLSGNTYTTGPITANCTVVATFIINSYTVTPSAGTGGIIGPNTAQTVNYGATTYFTISPDTGYSINSVTGCGGTLSGNTYTTGPITADCTVIATFIINSYTVTPSAGTGGTISPNTPQTVTYGSTKAFTVTPNTGYSIASVNGCGGSLSGNTYTTGAITANCIVTASFSLTGTSYTVTPVIGKGGTVTPRTPQTVTANTTKSFTVVPKTGYIKSPKGISGTCPKGSWSSNIWTTGAINANCSVNFDFLCSACIPSQGGWRATLRGY